MMYRKIPMCIKAFVIVTFLHCFLSTALFAKAKEEITVDQSRRMLVAPSACNYQWFYNNAPLIGETYSTLNVRESGFYTVEYTNEDGVESRQDAYILVQGTVITKVYIIGDSTVSTYSGSSYPMTGWGQIIPHFFTGNVQFINKAIGGRSSKSFYLEGRWTPIKNELAPGDFVFIQFGHNDRDFSNSTRYADTATYKRYLTMYVNETRSKGAHPVLITPMILNAWNGSTLRNVFTEGTNDYRGAMIQVANKLNVPYIDLNMKSFNLFRSLPRDYLTYFLYMGLRPGEYPNYPNGISDGTHFQEMGAVELTKLICQGISEQSQHPTLRDLAPYLKPVYQLSTSTNNTAAGLFTRSNTYPAGTPITIKVRPNSGYTFVRWADGAGTTVSTSQRTTFSMGSSSANYTALYSVGNTPSITLQENATGFCIVDGTVDSNYSGYTGSGFSNTNNVTGAGIRWRVSSTASGTYTLLFRHANGGTAARPARLLINGVTAISSINFPTTGSFSSWADVSVNVTLPAGSSDIRLEGTTADALSNIDYMKVTGASPSAASCSATATSITLEENATGFCSVDGTVDNNHPGFSGTGFANTNNVTGAGITWSVSTPASGSYTLLFRHANGGTARNARLLVNGVTSISSINFPTTGSFTSWADVSVNVTLSAGNSDIRLEGTTADALSNIDYMRVTGTSPSGVSCNATSGRIITTSETSGNGEDVVSVYPNPSSQLFTIKSKGAFRYKVTDLSGRVIENGQAKNITHIGNSLTPGTYVITIEHGQGVKNIKVLKK